MDRPGVGIGVIVLKDKKVLIGKRKAEHGNNTWQFPGGKLELFEEIKDCAKRETLEEANIEIDNIKEAEFTNDFFREQNKHYITLFVIADYKSGEVKVLEPDKCEEWIWCEWDKLPTPLFEPIKNLKKKGFNPFNQKAF